MSGNAENIVCKGEKRTIEYAVTNNGEMPAKNFLDSLSKGDTAKTLYLFQRYADHGIINDRRKFRKVEGDLFEFKSFQIRFICFMLSGGRVILTHGFLKQQDKIPHGEIEKAMRIREEFLAKIGGRK